jgi:hypothetical protein
MESFRTSLSAEYLRSVLRYDPDNGQFYWLIAGNGRTVGMVAGCVGTRAWHIVIDGQKYPAHRLAVLWMTGRWPSYLVDHKDRDRLNNKWCNLRQANRQQNAANMLRSPKSGLKGVRRDKKRWGARITVDGREIHLGNYDTAEEAHAAYSAAATKHFGEFARAS